MIQDICLFLNQQQAKSFLHLSHPLVTYHDGKSGQRGGGGHPIQDTMPSWHQCNYHPKNINWHFWWIASPQLVICQRFPMFSFLLVA